MQQQNDDRFQLAREIEHLLRTADPVDLDRSVPTPQTALADAAPSLQRVAAALNDESVEIPDSALGDVQDLLHDHAHSPLHGTDGAALRAAADRIFEHLRRWA